MGWSRKFDCDAQALALKAQARDVVHKPYSDGSNFAPSMEEWEERGVELNKILLQYEKIKKKYIKEAEINWEICNA